MEESTACAELPFQFSFSSHPRVLNVLGVQTTNNHRLTKGKYGRYYCPKQVVLVEYVPTFSCENETCPPVSVILSYTTTTPANSQLRLLLCLRSSRCCFQGRESLEKFIKETAHT